MYEETISSNPITQCMVTTIQEMRGQVLQLCNYCRVPYDYTRNIYTDVGNVSINIVQMS